MSEIYFGFSLDLFGFLINNNPVNVFENLVEMVEAGAFFGFHPVKTIESGICGIFHPNKTSGDPGRAVEAPNNILGNPDFLILSPESLFLNLN